MFLQIQVLWDGKYFPMFARSYSLVFKVKQLGLFDPMYQGSMIIGNVSNYFKVWRA
jgi:hypothetical protein